MFEAFYVDALRLFEKLGTKPTYISVTAPGFTGKYVKYSDRFIKRLEATKYRGISVIGLVANPPNSDAPSFDRFVSVSFQYDAAGEMIFCATANSGLGGLRTLSEGGEIDRWAQRYIWSFGYAFEAPVVTQPDFYVLGLDNGQLTKREQAALSRWYNSDPSTKRSKLRNVYRINFLNEVQLAQNVAPGVTLLEYIQSDEHFLIRYLGRLMMWELPAHLIASVAQKLSASGILIE